MLQSLVESAEMPRRILVTGANGFVGRHLVAELVRRLAPSDRIFACSRSGDDPGLPAVESLPMNLADDEEVETIIRRVLPTDIFHLAGMSTLAAVAIDPDAAWRVNLFATLRLADSMARHCPGGRFLFAGSSEVYGRAFQGARAVDEGVLPDPTNLYAVIKAATEMALRLRASDRLTILLARPFNHVGPGQREDFALSSFAAQIARIECGLQAPVMRVGNLESERDFLDVRDIVDGYCRLAERAGQLPNGILVNFASGVPRRMQSVLDALLAMARVPIEVLPDHGRMRSSDTPLVLGNADRARDLLDWTPRHAWNRTLADILDHWRGLVA